MYFKRNNEARRRHWFGEADNTGGFKHIGSNTFSNRRVRHSLEFRREFRLETQTWKNQNLLTTSDQYFSVLARSLLILPLAGFYLSRPA